MRLSVPVDSQFFLTNTPEQPSDSGGAQELSDAVRRLSNTDLIQRVSLTDAKEPVVICPYCGSRFDNGEQLSKHTDRVHSGSGLLEGNKGKI